MDTREIRKRINDENTHDLAVLGLLKKESRLIRYLEFLDLIDKLDVEVEEVSNDGFKFPDLLKDPIIYYPKSNKFLIPKINKWNPKGNIVLSKLKSKII
jgi:hypothetical protein